MECVHREDAKLRASENPLYGICVICMAERVSDSQISISDRIYYAQSCLNQLSIPITKLSVLNKNTQIFFTAFKVIWSKILHLRLCLLMFI